MACSSCSSGKGGTPGGCQNKGNCSTGGCNKLNTYDWLSKMDIPTCNELDIIEVSFKNGARKGFYNKPPQFHIHSGQTVVVEAGAGYDMGRVSLMGELVRLQMKKKRVAQDAVAFNVLRTANERDLERLDEARNKERAVMVKSRAIARSLNLDMKIGDVEFQGDKRKATFYYTAEGRVDFRELIRHFAREFRIKVEMRQIGARQESARIGGLGSCGRELCCSTWLTDFKSVSTTAARYQNLAINQSKLSGQCGRLKCCLNYELDTYLDALKAFPKKADRIQTLAGMAILLKTDIFRGIMYYAYKENMGKYYALKVDRVKELLVLNANGEKPAELIDSKQLAEDFVAEIGFEDGSGEIELPPEKRRRKKSRNRRKRGDNNSTNSNTRAATPKKSASSKDSTSSKAKSSSPRSNKTSQKPSSKTSTRNKGKASTNRPTKSTGNSTSPQTSGKTPTANKSSSSSSKKPRSSNSRNEKPKSRTPENKAPKKKAGNEGGNDNRSKSKNRNRGGRNRRGRSQKPNTENKSDSKE